MIHCESKPMTRYLRLILVLSAIALVATVAILSPAALNTGLPASLETGLYKLSLAAMAAIAGYYIDIALYPYARPDGYLISGDWLRLHHTIDDDADYPVVKGYELIFAISMLRRALIVLACVIGVCLGM